MRRYVFGIFAAVVVLGLFNGVVALPVVLSLIGASGPISTDTRSPSGQGHRGQAAVELQEVAKKTGPAAVVDAADVSM